MDSLIAPVFLKQLLFLSISLLFYKSVNCGDVSPDDFECEIKWIDGGIIYEETTPDETERHRKCLETNPFDTSASGMEALLARNASLEEFVNVDDNCFTQCDYKADNILTDEGFINRNETARLFQGNLTDPIYKKVTTLWTDCIAESERIAKEKETDNCRMLALHLYCFSMRAGHADLFKVDCHYKNPHRVVPII